MFVIIEQESDEEKTKVKEYIQKLENDLKNDQDALVEDVLSSIVDQVVYKELSAQCGPSYSEKISKKRKYQTISNISKEESDEIDKDREVTDR